MSQNRENRTPNQTMRELTVENIELRAKLQAAEDELDTYVRSDKHLSIEALTARAEAAEEEVARLKGAGYTGRFGDLIDIQDRRIAALEAGLDYCIKQIPEFATVPGIAALLDGRGE